MTPAATRALASPAGLGRLFLWALDAMTLGALLGTREVDPRSVVVLGAVLLLRFLGARVKSRWPFVAAIVVLIGAGIVAVVRFRLHPLVSAAHVAVVIHGLLWLGPEEVRDRVLRLAMGFIDLMLAAALTTDLYLLPVILAIAVLGSLYLGTSFLETRLRELAPELERAPVPPGFVRNMLFVSAAVFVVSLALFPVIPRSNWRRFDEGSSSIGYRESIDLTEAAAAALQRSYKPALRIGALNPGDDPVKAMPGHLLRGKDLELFDGAQWVPKAAKRVVQRQHPFGAVADGEYVVHLQPQLAGHFFRPYGARVVAVLRGELNYEYRVEKRSELDAFGVLPEEGTDEEPYELHLRVPDYVRSGEIAALARRIFAGARTAREKVGALARFYKDGFQGTLEAQSASDPAVLMANFLLRDKKGHCDIFASSAALLLRLVDVPTRLVAGYRPAHRAHQGLLIVTEGDAHAWLEYWDPARGWSAFDPTPLMLVAYDWAEPLREFYWKVDGLWDEYILNFRKGGHDESEPGRRIAPSDLARFISESATGHGFGRSVLMALAVMATFGALVYFFMRRGPWFTMRRRATAERRHRALGRECESMARLLRPMAKGPGDLVFNDLTARVRERFGAAAATAYEQWQDEFLRQRYGALPDAVMLSTLKRLRASFAVATRRA
jgi:transglutaminase-like putative cysteine protease